MATGPAPACDCCSRLRAGRAAWRLQPRLVCARRAPAPDCGRTWAGSPTRSQSGLGLQAGAQGCRRLRSRQRGLGKDGRGRFPRPRSSTVHVLSFVPLGGLAGPWWEERVFPGSSAERLPRGREPWCPVFPGDAGTLGEDAGSSGARNAGGAANGLICCSVNQLLHSGF